MVLTFSAVLEYFSLYPDVIDILGRVDSDFNFEVARANFRSSGPHGRLHIWHWSRSLARAHICIMASSSPATDIFTENPYEHHPSLSSLEAEALWEYAKLAQHVKQVPFTVMFASRSALIDFRHASS